MGNWWKVGRVMNRLEGFIFIFWLNKNVEMVRWWDRKFIRYYVFFVFCRRRYLDGLIEEKLEYWCLYINVYEDFLRFWLKM